MMQGLETPDVASINCTENSKTKTPLGIPNARVSRFNAIFL
jgi:hypothetical protein